MELEWCREPVPLPQWFVKGKKAKLSSVSMIDNFHSYLQNLQETSNDFIKEIKSRQHYKAKFRAPYSSQFLRFALLLRYASAQAYQLLLQHLPFPSMSLPQRLKQGKVDALKAAVLLKEKNAICQDVILMADEMYLQKKAVYSSGEYIGVDDSGNPFKGIVVFMICGLKASIPIVVKACPEISLNGKWIANHIVECISSLSKAGFRIRGIVTDNHSSNVSAFKILKKMFAPQQGTHDSLLYIQHPDSQTKTYLFF